MALKRWSLHRTVLGLGLAAQSALFVPMALALLHRTASGIEAALETKALGLGGTVAHHVVNPLLMNRPLEVHYALRSAVGADPDIRALLVIDAQGEVLAHTYEAGVPAELLRLYQRTPGPVRRFQGDGVPMLDLEIPILHGELGALHVTVSRARVFTIQQDRLRPVLAALLAALVIVVAGAWLTARVISRPLRTLAEAVARYPEDRTAFAAVPRARVQELDTLAAGFTVMARRLAAFEDQRKSLQEHLVHTERLAVLGVLAASLAHEIRNPLDGLLEAVRLLGEQPERADRVRQFAPLLREGLERIDRVMQQMLTLARGNVRLHEEERPLGALFESLALLVAPRAARAGVAVEWPAPDRWCRCRYDVGALTQALLNVVLNALDAASHWDRGAAGRGVDPRVRVTVEYAGSDEPGAGSWLDLVVADSGPGVPAELRDAIFEPFFTTRPAGRGTGLGLALARYLLRELGGDLRLDPDPAGLGGASFRLRLPCAAAREIPA